jgi:hypothetical protein
MMEHRFVLALAGACFVAASCSDTSDTYAERAQAAPDMRALMATERSAPARFAGDDADAGSTQPVGTEAAAMLIRSGEARIEVRSVERARAAVRALAEGAGGSVADATTYGGGERSAQASLTLKLPAARFDDVVEQLARVGDVRTLRVESADVGEEYVDAGARLANARRLEERLLELLATRTGNLQDVLAVERELARVREQIERQEGRLRFLAGRVATSTLVVTVFEPAPFLAGYSGENVIAGAFERAVRNFVALVAFVIASLGVVLPVAAVGAIVWLIVRRRSRGRRTPAPETA